MEEFKKVETTDVKKFENEGDSIQGVYIDYEESKMYPESYALRLRDTTEDKVFVVFVSELLINKIKVIPNLKPHETVLSVLYVGRQKNKEGTREYKNYEVYYK